MKNDNVKIVHCPKGGRVPEGYCLNSCLNHPGSGRRGKGFSLQKQEITFPGNDDSRARPNNEESARTVS